jgi:hypothetical protein
MRPASCTLLLVFLPTFAHGESALTARVTLYGYADNDPPGVKIAHPRMHSEAGGTGTYDDPITFAANPKRFPPGTKIYVPHMRKYFIMEDDCASAIAAKQGPPLIDLWAGGSRSSHVGRLLTTERLHTRESAHIIVNPSPNYSVEAEPIFADRDSSRSDIPVE